MEGRFEGLSREQAEALFGPMVDGARNYALDFLAPDNPQWHFDRLWRGVTIEECLADKANFLQQGMRRGSKLIPILVLLARYVCSVKRCGAHLEAVETGDIWTVRCQRDLGHSGIERALYLDAREREAKSLKAMREMEHVPAAQMFDEMYENGSG